MCCPQLLLVDDSLEMGVIIRALGRRSACDVSVCLDAENARRALERQSPDLLLLDVNLPGVSGPELCRLLRKDARWERLPVAVFTHWDLAGDIASALDAGAQYVFSKDLVTEPHRWQQRLGEILEHARGQGLRPSLAWQHNSSLTEAPTGWTTQLRRVLDHTLPHLVRPEIARVLVRKALDQTWPGRIGDAAGPSKGSTSVVCSTSFGSNDAKDASLPGATLLPADLLPEGINVNQAAGLVNALCEQVECVMGAQASEPARAELARLLVGPGEGVARR
jgi:CheY-like chemotaxis protein